MPSKNRALY
jgi:hypothetical protein